MFRVLVNPTTRFSFSGFLSIVFISFPDWTDDRLLVLVDWNCVIETLVGLPVIVFVGLLTFVWTGFVAAVVGSSGFVIVVLIFGDALLTSSGFVTFSALLLFFRMFVADFCCINADDGLLMFSDDLQFAKRFPEVFFLSDLLTADVLALVGFFLLEASLFGSLFA